MCRLCVDLETWVTIDQLSEAVGSIVQQVEVKRLVDQTREFTYKSNAICRNYPFGHVFNQFNPAIEPVHLYSFNISGFKTIEEKVNG
jgi:hypothetical protein